MKLVNAVPALWASKPLQLILQGPYELTLAQGPGPPPLSPPSHPLRLSYIQDSHTHVFAFLRPPSPPTSPLDSAAPMAPTAPRPRPELLEHLGISLSSHCLGIVFSFELLAGRDLTLSLCPATQQVSATQRTEEMQGRELTRLCAYHLPGVH